MVSQATASPTKPKKFETAETKVRRKAEIFVLSERARALTSGCSFQSVDDIVDRITERAHRVAGY